MEFKTTAFAIFLIVIFTWRNIKIAKIQGKRYVPYGLDMYKGPNPFKEMQKRFKEGIEFVKNRKNK